jgi:hypothetical protein
MVRFYILTHRRTELGRPVVYSLQRASQYNDALFCDYAKKVEELRQQGGRDLPYYLTKREIERWIVHPPCGPRMEVIPVAIHPDELK